MLDLRTYFGLLSEESVLSLRSLLCDRFSKTSCVRSCFRFFFFKLTHLSFLNSQQVKARLQKMGALTSMNIFLRQEIDRMQRVITAVRSTLVDLKLAIDGTIIMSENLKDALDNIYDARVPGLWKKVGYLVRV